MERPTFKDQSTHCIQVAKIYDWINLKSELTMKERVCFENPNPFTDIICSDFQISCERIIPTTLWTKAGIDHIGGTVSIEYIIGCGHPLMVIINGEIKASLMEGQSFSASIDELKFVELLCEGGPDDVGFCLGEFKIILHYQPEEFKLDISDVKCFLSDCYGHPLESCSIVCEEISSNRETIHVGGKTLFKVIIRKKGFITVQIIGKRGCVCKVCTFPFTIIERLILCAPPGTKLECEVVDCDCEVYFTPIMDWNNPYIEVSIFLSCCQSIQMVGETKMEVKGIICTSRKGNLLENNSSI